MRSRLLVSTAILIAGLAVASAQNAPDGAGQNPTRDGVHRQTPNQFRYPPQGQMRGEWRGQHRRTPDAAARTAEPRSRATGSFGMDRDADDLRRSAASARNGRQDLLPPAKHNDASVLPPRNRSWRGGRGQRDGLSTDRSSDWDRSLWDHSYAQGRMQQEDRQGHRRQQPAPPLTGHDQRDLARTRAQHPSDRSLSDRHLTDQGMGSAVRKLGSAHRQVRSQPPHGAAAAGAGKPDIRKVQEALNQQGFNAGDADGRFGQRTKEALIAFQKQNGFRTTGKVDHATLHALLGGAPTAPDAAGNPDRSPATPAAAEPPSSGPSTTTGQGGAVPRAPMFPPPATAPLPVEGEMPAAPPPPEGMPPPPDTDVTKRVPAGAPPDDDDMAQPREEER
jgi:peptidoglycan hydrolase-like protein with peptidoglycan-binding domain